MFLLFIFTQICLGLLYGNFAEWVMHKYVLHVLGKRKKSIFSFHWYEHHRKSKINKFKDSDYEKPIWCWNARGKEAVGLFLLWLTHSWLFLFFPIFAATITYCTINYYFTHKWAHQNPEWAKKNLKWHWDHHQMKYQDANFCVTRPWFDWIMCTRVYYRTDAEKNKNGSRSTVNVNPCWFRMEF